MKCITFGEEHIALFRTRNSTFSDLALHILVTCKTMTLSHLWGGHLANQQEKMVLRVTFSPMAFFHNRQHSDT